MLNEVAVIVVAGQLKNIVINGDRILNRQVAAITNGQDPESVRIGLHTENVRIVKVQVKLKH